MLFLTSMTFISAWRALRAVQQLAITSTSTFSATPGLEAATLSKRWRAERNVWIAGFASFAW
jgi:hypothetical protein